MGTLPDVSGLPLAEAERRLVAAGFHVVRVRRTGEVGRARAERRSQREGLADAGERVLRAKPAESGGVELLVGESYRLAEP